MKANKNSEYRDGTLYSSLMAADKPCPQLQQHIQSFPRGWVKFEIKTNIMGRSGIDVAPGIFGKNNEHSPLKKRSHFSITDNLNISYIAKGKQAQKFRKKF